MQTARVTAILAPFVRRTSCFAFSWASFLRRIACFAFSWFELASRPSASGITSRGKGCIVSVGIRRSLGLASRLGSVIERGGAYPRRAFLKVVIGDEQKMKKYEKPLVLLFFLSLHPGQGHRKSPPGGKPGLFWSTRRIYM